VIEGALIGLVGPVVKGIAGLWRDHQRRKHEIEQRKLDLEASKIEHAHAMERAKVEQATRLQESADDLREASYDQAKSRFNVEPTGWSAQGIVWAEVLRMSTRPVLTAVLVVASWATLGDYNPPGASYSMLEQLSACAVTWWFGDRGVGKILDKN
jgi:hypothetical protein